MRLRYAGLLAAPLLAACSAIPWSGTPGTPQGRAAHRVVYTVRCEQCTVAYSTDTGMSQAQMKGLWSKTVDLANSATGQVVLTAVPSTSAAMVSHAYIEVDGKRLAEARRNTRDVFTDQVTLTARLPDISRVTGR